MAHDAALLIINTAHQQFATLARAIVRALADGKIAPIEGMTLSMQAMSLGTSLVTLFQGLDPATRGDCLTVLEHGHFVMEDTP
jgi:hypothetical protein